MKHYPMEGYPDRPANVAESLWKLYWDKKRDGERLARQTAAKVAHRKALDEAHQSNAERLKTLLPPVMRLESKHPNGVIVHWEKPENWEPDTYIVLVREVGNDWRSVASKTITVETRDMVLTNSYLAWGEYREPYEITVEAVWDGYGNVGAAPQRYPPETVEEPVFKEVTIDDNPYRETRMDTIVRHTGTFDGKRTRSGKPYVRHLRKHADMPDISVTERNQAWKLHTQGQ